MNGNLFILFPNLNTLRIKGICRCLVPIYKTFACRLQWGAILHDDVIKWKHFPRYWPFVRGIHRCPVSSPHKGQWRRAFIFSLIWAWIDGWVNNREAGDLIRYRVHSDVTVMVSGFRVLAMVTPWQENVSALLVLCEGDHGSSLVSLHKRPMIPSLIFSLMLAWTKCWQGCRWFETS